MALAVCLSVSLLSGSVAAAQQSERTRQEELAELRSEISRLETELTGLDAKHRDLDRERAEVSVALELQAARWREAEASRFLAEQALVATESEVERLQGEVAAAEVALRARLGSLYRIGRNGELRLLLSIGSRDGLLPGSRTLRYLARRDSDNLERFREAEIALAAELESLEERREEKRRWEEVEAGRWEELVAMEKKIGRELEGLEQSRENRATTRDRLASRAARLDDLLEYLRGTPGREVDARPMNEFEGALELPVEGRIGRGFGPVLDPRYGTQVPHDGVEIGVDHASTVRAVYPGEVLFAAPLDGYGLTVVLRHPGRVFTLYSGLDALRVERGGVVALDAAVGVTSTRLYFEIRVGNRPVDPEPWFRGAQSR